MHMVQLLKYLFLKAEEWLAEFYAEIPYGKSRNSMKSDDQALELGVSKFYTITSDLTYRKSLEKQ